MKRQNITEIDILAIPLQSGNHVHAPIICIRLLLVISTAIHNCIYVCLSISSYLYLVSMVINTR